MSDKISIVTASIGGLIAAAIGGGIWGFIVIKTGYEIGYAAIGVGALCAFAVIFFSGGSSGIRYSIIACVTSFLGILIGRYFTVFQRVKEYVASEQGAETAKGVSMLSGKFFVFFFSSLPGSVDFFDLLWIALAMGAAWKISQSVEEDG